ncbi:MAG: YbjQ family protein [Bacteroidia bacterium]
MILSTTNIIEGKPVSTYLGIVTSEVIIGANFMKDIMGGLRDFFGGRSGTYEQVLREAKENALNELRQNAQALGADGVIGIDLDYETVGSSGSMLMVTVSGTAVKF